MQAKIYGETAVNWVKLKAYEDGAFVLRVILERFESDVAEVNQLPERVRAFRTFSVHRTGDYHATISRESHNGRNTMLTLQVGDDAVLLTGGPESIPAPIRAVHIEETGEVQWLLDNHLVADDEKRPVPLWQLSRSLLGRYVFEFK